MKKENLKKSLLLFAFFFKIGCFTFGGGWSILAQMEQEFVDKKHWITKEELLDMTALGKSVPGIMITNISMIFGYSVAGWFGGLCSVLGIACPAILILTIITFLYDSLKENQWCDYLLKGVRSAVVPIMASAAYSLSKGLFTKKRAILILITAFLLCTFTSISNILLILAGVVLAFILMGVEKQ
ncbi:MAG: chromate transporter [Lachnospiraceae bacterium]